MRNQIHNLRDVWLEGYERLLDEARASGTVTLLADPDERRDHPRFHVQSDDVATAEEGPVDLQDMSVSGLAFRSRRSYFSDRSLTVSLANVFSTETEVLGCERLPDAAETGSPRFRVRCRFRDAEHGLQFLTLTLELERVERA